jgi:hypothetical protein
MSSNSSIPFHRDHGNLNDVEMLPDDGVMLAGSRKRKQAFSMKDPDNVELARLATQAAKKKTKLSMNNSSGKEITHQKKAAGPKLNCQPSNSKNVHGSEAAGDSDESDDDDEAATAEATKKKGVSKPTRPQNKKNRNSKKKKTVPTKQNRQPSVEDEDDSDLSDNHRENVVNIVNLNGLESDDDGVEVVEQPAESAEEELS